MQPKTLLVTCLIAVAWILFGSPAAQAHYNAKPPTGEPVYCGKGDLWSRVWVCFEQDGDDIWVHDGSADGYRARAQWWTDYGRYGICDNTHGAGTWHECDYDMSESGKLYFQQWAYDGDTNDYDGSGQIYCLPINWGSYCP